MFVGMITHQYSKASITIILQLCSHATEQLPRGSKVAIRTVGVHFGDLLGLSALS